MKDPLHTEETPYEILGVEQGATPEDIERAFRSGLMRRGNVEKLSTAKRVLQRPADRALVDLFLYDRDALARVSPSPLHEPSCLLVSQRGATAQMWTEQLKAYFPDTGIAH